MENSLIIGYDFSHDKDITILTVGKQITETVSLSAATPLLRETMEIRVDGKVLTVYKDEIEKELYKHLGVGLMQFGGWVMTANEFTEFLDTTSEAWKQITDAIQEFANSLSEIEETHNIENSYHKPKKNEYLKSQTCSLYQVERRVQKHLPMGFSYFKRREK